MNHKKKKNNNSHQKKSNCLWPSVVCEEPSVRGDFARRAEISAKTIANTSRFSYSVFLLRGGLRVSVLPHCTSAISATSVGQGGGSQALNVARAQGKLLNAAFDVFRYTAEELGDAL